MNIKTLEKTYELDVYPRRDVVLVRGEGAKLYDIEGKEYIDCASNIGVSNIGHGNRSVAKAIYDQYLTLGNCYTMFYNPIRAKLAEKLISMVDKKLTKIYFCNSGAESIEAAIKFARATTGKKQIIASMRGFHGKTMGALAATWGPAYQKPFTPMLQGFAHVPYNNIQKLQDSINDDTAAIILEAVQGEGGVRPGNKKYFLQVRKICDAKNILLVMDEVQTGFGRTGSMFAYEQYVTPDILCLAKSLAGGLPMGAVICSDEIKIPLKSHTSTFGGNPTVCSAALASIQVIEQEGLVKNARTLGRYFLKELHSIKSKKVREVRGLGLMLGIELKEKAGRIVNQLMNRGVIALLAGPTVIRLLPPLVITKKEIDIVLKTIGDVL